MPFVYLSMRGILPIRDSVKTSCECSKEPFLLDFVKHVNADG